MTIETKIKKLDDRVKDLERYLKSTEKKKRKTRPEMDEKYWYLDEDVLILSSTWEDSAITDHETWNSGNGFFTKEEAERERDKRLAIQRVKDYIRENFDEFVPDHVNNNLIKQVIYYDHSEKKLVACGDVWNRQFNYSFEFPETSEQCKQLLKDMKKDLEIIWGIDGGGK